MTTGLLEKLSERITGIRKKQLSYLTTEQAKEYGFDLDPGWAVKIDWEAAIPPTPYTTPLEPGYKGTPAKPRYTYVSPEGWEFADFAYGDNDELMDYLALSPEGRTYTKGELETQQLETATLQTQYEKGLAGLEPFKAEEGGYNLSSIREALRAGISRDFLTQAFGQEAVEGAGLPVEPTTFPERIEPAPVEPTTADTLFQRIYPDLWRFRPETEEPVDVAQQINTWISEDQEGFLEDLRKRGDTPDTRSLLRMLGGEELTELDIDDFFIGVPKISEEAVQFKQSLMSALPLIVKPRTIDWAVQYFGNNPDKLRRELITAGRNENTEVLVKSLYPQITERGLEDYFSPAVPSKVEGITPVMPALTWLDRVAELRGKPTQLIPFVSSGVEIYTISKLLMTAKDLEDGKEVSKEDLLALKEYVDRSLRDTDWGYKVADVVSQLLPFAGEFIATGGIFSFGKTAAIKGASIALKKLVTRAGASMLEKRLAQMGLQVVGTVAGGTLRAIVTGVVRVPALTLEKQLQATLTGDEESVWNSAVKSFGQHWVEIVSESTGGMFGAVANPIKGQMIKAGLFKAFLKANPAKATGDVKKVFERLGYHGILGEMLEERVADVGHGVLYELGLGDQKFSIPSLEQLSVELAAFSIPGLASQAVGRIGAVKPAIKAAITEAKVAPERGAIEIPGEIPTEAIKPAVTPITEAKGVVPEVPTVPEKPALVAQPSPEWVRLSTSARIKLIQSIPTDERVKIGLTTGDANVAWNKLSPEKKQAIRSKIVPEVAIPKVVTEPFQPEAGYQPTMIEGVTEKEVRPVGKGKVIQISMEEQLKLQQARRAVEEAPPELQKAYEAQEQITGLQITHETDPIASLRFQIGQRTVGKGEKAKVVPRMVSIDQLVDVKEKTFAYNDSFTPSQARAIKPNTIFSEANKLPNGRVRADAVLDELADQHTGGDVQAFIDRVNQIRAEKQQIKALQLEVTTQMTEKPLETLPEPTPEEINLTKELLPFRSTALTKKQEDALTGFLGEYLAAPSAITAWELARQSMSETLGERVVRMRGRTEELIALVKKGEITFEQAQKQALSETMSGELRVKATELFDDITAELRDACFAKVYRKLEGYPLERIDTVTALTNLLAGYGIPTIRPTPPPGGFKSRLWPQGASAYDKLNYVFGDQPKLMEGLKRMSEKKQSLRDVVEGIFHETGRVPIPVDQATADYLRSLSEIPFGYRTLLEKPFILPSLPLDTRTVAQKAIDLENFKLELTPETWKGWTPQRLEQLSYLRINLLKPEYQTKLAEAGWTPPAAIADQRTPAQRALDLDLFKIEMAKPPTPVAKFEAPIEDAFKRVPLMPMAEKQMIVRLLKEAGLIIIDIGNLIRANVASFDQSFLRQSKMLASGHPLIGIAGHNAAWRATFSQKVAEAERELILKDPDFEIYEQIRITKGYDPLRVPSWEITKGTERWRGAEEYGFPGGGRLIPRLTAQIPHIKYSERGFVTGTNKIVWGVWKLKLREVRRDAEKIASGQHKLPEGEALDIIQEMTDHQRFLGDAIQRASLGRLQGLAPAMGALFFAARSKLGRFFFPRHLISSNPRVRAEAWRDFMLMNAFWGGLMFLGDWLDLWETEKDPRNAEFMSARIGKIRIDPWAGYRQFVVLYARLVTGTGISSVTGAEYEINKLGALQNFFRTSLAPMPSILLDFWTGRNFLGQVVEITNAKQWVERLAPFLIKDVWESFEEEGIKGAAIAIVPAIYGEGVQAYTGDWEENWTKLGLPKYLENTAYGLTEPKYLTDDFWADTASQFKGVDPAILTEKKGFPPYIRAIAEARIINEHLSTLPNEKLVNLNADPSKGVMFGELRNLWSQRQGLVDAGDKAEFIENELQPDGTYKKVTYKGDDAVTAFDKHEFAFRGITVKGSQANQGNFSQRQFALLNEYWSITDKTKQAEFLKEHETEIGIKLTDEYLRTHPKENAQLAIWGQAKLLTREAYTQFKGMVKALDIPDNAIPELTLPPEGSVGNYFDRLDAIDKYEANSAEAMIFLAKDEELQTWLELDKPEQPVRYYELKIKNREQRVYWDDISDKDSPNFIEDNPDTKIDERRDDFAKKFPDTFAEYWDDERRTEGIANKFTDTEIEDWVARGRLVDEYSGNSPAVKQWAFDNPEAYRKALEQKMIKDKGGLPTVEERGHYEKWVEPAIRLQVKNMKEDARWEELGDKNQPDKYIKDDKKRRVAFLKEFPNSEYFDDMERIEAYKVGFTEMEAGLWAMRGQTVAKFEPNSSEVKLWLVDHSDVWKKALDAELLTDDGSDWNIPVMRIDVQWREQDKAYAVIPDKYDKMPDAEIYAMTAPEGFRVEDWKLKTFDERRKALTRIDRDQFHIDNPEWHIADIKRNGYQLGLSEATAEGKWLEYNQLPEYGDWRKRYLRDDPAFFKEVTDRQKALKQNPWDVPLDVKELPYDEIYENYKDLFKSYESTGDKYSRMSEDEINKIRKPTDIQYADWAKKTPGQKREKLASIDRERIFNENPAFKEAYYRRQAYGKLFDEKYVNNYVTYMLLPKKGYADERFLKSHMEFYLYAKKKIGWTEDIPWNKIPSEAVEKLWDEYQILQDRKVGQAALDSFRSGHLDLDDWLYITGKVTVRITDKVRKWRLTSHEKFERDFEEMIKELREKLGAL